MVWCGAKANEPEQSGRMRESECVNKGRGLVQREGGHGRGRGCGRIEIGRLGLGDGGLRQFFKVQDQDQGGKECTSSAASCNLMSTGSRCCTLGYGVGVGVGEGSAEGTLLGTV